MQNAIGVNGSNICTLWQREWYFLFILFLHLNNISIVIVRCRRLSSCRSQLRRRVAKVCIFQFYFNFIFVYRFYVFAKHIFRRRRR